MKTVAVIGGGASGMFAAIAAAEQGAVVTIFEQNEKTGKKLFITGKGRCNLTNDCEALPFHDAVLRNTRFLYSAYSAFPERDVMDWFEKAGVPLKVERGGRVFPASDHSSDILRALNAALSEKGVSVRLNCRVKGIRTEEGRAAGVELADGSFFPADAVILASGGLSYPSTGANDSGHRMAASLGHTVTETRPGLVPLETAEEWPKSLSGLSLRNVGLKLVSGDKICYDGFGEMLFTHFGVSGPLVLSASSEADEALQSGDCRILLDLKPALTDEQLDARLVRELSANSKKTFQNAVASLFPSRLRPVMTKLSGIDPDKRASEVTKKERARFASLIRALPLTVTGKRDYNEAIITIGGVDVREIDPRTMESKKIKGLYLAGELLDLDALTGGYNLQIAWSTGHAAGVHAAAAV